MIILDTNVVSEPLRTKPMPVVQRWLDRQIPEHLFTTAVSVSELLLGVESLPLGRRRTTLSVDVRRILADLFGPRVLSFDERAALAYAKLVAKARTRGIAVGVADGQIAAIALVHGFAVATRRSFRCRRGADHRPLDGVKAPVSTPPRCGSTCPHASGRRRR